MGDYRSKSFAFNDGGRGMEMESYYPNNDFRSYSAAYVTSSNGGGGGAPPQPPLALPPPPGGLGGVKDKGKSKISKSWSMGDAEFQRKRRVASYKVYSVEGKVKGSFRKSYRWVKDKCTQVVYGWW